MAEAKEPTPKRTSAKRAPAKRAGEQATPVRDSVDQLFDALAEVAAKARIANAAEPAVEPVWRAGVRFDELARWPARLRRRARTS
jgi:hypothetical protein